MYRGTGLAFHAPLAFKEKQLVTTGPQRQFALEAGLLHRLRHSDLPRVGDHFLVPGGQYLVFNLAQDENPNQVPARRVRACGNSAHPERSSSPPADGSSLPTYPDSIVPVRRR
jgi:hypothetical protein